jgi:putative oxidoreductase
MRAGRLLRVLGHPVVGALCRLVLGGIFIYTSLPKLMHPGEFARLVYGYRILHPDMVNLAGITLPWIELAAGAFLVIGIIPRSSALVLAGLLGLFIGAGFLALARGLDIECGCFFPFMSDHKLTWDLLVRDAVLILFALQIMAWPSGFLPVRRARRQLSGS